MFINLIRKKYQLWLIININGDFQGHKYKKNIASQRKILTFSTTQAVYFDTMTIIYSIFLIQLGYL